MFNKKEWLDLLYICILAGGVGFFCGLVINILENRKIK
jgi:hypothetical protein